MYTLTPKNWPVLLKLPGVILKHLIGQAFRPPVLLPANSIALSAKSNFFFVQIWVNSSLPPPRPPASSCLWPEQLVEIRLALFLPNFLSQRGIRGEMRKNYEEVSDKRMREGRV
jgi:hypothetical protein